MVVLQPPMIGPPRTITPPETTRRRKRSRSEEEGLQRPFEEDAFEENGTFTPAVLLLFQNGDGIGAVPASDACPARGLARVGAVAGQRTAPVQVIGAALNPCIAPRPGPNVCLAGKPRVVAKLHRPWPGGVCPPRGPTPLWCEGAPRLRAGPCHAKRPEAGRVLRTGRDRAGPEPFPNARPAIPNHPRSRPSTPGSGRAPIATSHGLIRRGQGSRIAPSSQEIRLRNTPVKSTGDPTS